MTFKIIATAVVAAMGIFITLGNYEFLLYGTTLILLALFLLKTDSLARYTPFSKICLWIWLLLHIAGGTVPIANGEVLYSQILIPLVGAPYHILKFDQLVHAFCYFMFAQLVYALLRATLQTAMPRWGFLLLVWFATMGIGALNELIEFTATVIVPETNVGDYINNALDLVFNGLGAAIACLLFPLTARAPKRTPST